MSIPKELARREERLAAIRQAKAQIEAGAAERDAVEQADFDAKMKAREEKATRTGHKPGGNLPHDDRPRRARRKSKPTEFQYLVTLDARLIECRREGRTCERFIRLPQALSICPSEYAKRMKSPPRTPRNSALF